MVTIKDRGSIHFHFIFLQKRFTFPNVCDNVDKILNDLQSSNSNT